MLSIKQQIKIFKISSFNLTEVVNFLTLGSGFLLGLAIDNFKSTELNRDNIKDLLISNFLAMALPSRMQNPVNSRYEIHNSKNKKIIYKKFFMKDLKSNYHKTIPFGEFEYQEIEKIYPELFKETIKNFIDFTDSELINKITINATDNAINSIKEVVIAVRAKNIISGETKKEKKDEKIIEKNKISLLINETNDQELNIKLKKIVDKYEQLSEKIKTSEEKEKAEHLIEETLWLKSFYKKILPSLNAYNQLNELEQNKAIMVEAREELIKQISLIDDYLDQINKVYIDNNIKNKIKTLKQRTIILEKTLKL